MAAWSNITQDEHHKKEISERFLKTGAITDEDWTYCDSIDWHLVDELPLKDSFIKEIQSRKEEKAVRYKSVDEFSEKL